MTIAMHQSNGKPTQRDGKADTMAAVTVRRAFDGAERITGRSLRVDDSITRSV